MDKKSESVLNTSNSKNARDHSAKIVDILENPIDLQRYEFIDDFNIFKHQLKSLKEKILSVEKYSAEEQRHIAHRMVSLYQLQINYFSKNHDHLSVHKTIVNYHRWKKAIIDVGRLGKYFDIFKVSQEDATKLNDVLKEILVPIQFPEFEVPLEATKAQPLDISGPEINAPEKAEEVAISSEFLIIALNGIFAGAAHGGFLSIPGLKLQHPEIDKDKALWNRR